MDFVFYYGKPGGFTLKKNYFLETKVRNLD